MGRIKTDSVSQKLESLRTKYSKGNKVENEYSLKDVLFDIDKEGIEYAFESYSDYREIKDKKFHTLRKEYLKALKDVQNLTGLSPKDKLELRSTFDKEGVDYALTSYSDWGEIKNIKFQKNRKKYIAAKDNLLEYLGAENEKKDGGEMAGGGGLKTKSGGTDKRFDGEKVKKKILALNEKGYVVKKIKDDDFGWYYKIQKSEYKDSDKGTGIGYKYSNLSELSAKRGEAKKPKSDYFYHNSHGNNDASLGNVWNHTSKDKPGPGGWYSFDQDYIDNLLDKMSSKADGGFEIGGEMAGGGGIKKSPTEATIKMHINTYSVSDDPYEIAKEIGLKYGWSEKEIEKAESIIRKKYIKEDGGYMAMGGAKKPFIVYDKKSKQWIVLYANETKAEEFENEDDAKKFLKRVSGKKEDGGYMDKGGNIKSGDIYTAISDGRIGIYSGSDAYSAEVKQGDEFIVNSDQGLYLLGDLKIKGTFKWSPGLSGKESEGYREDKIVYTLMKQNIDGDSDFFAQFTKSKKAERGIMAEGGELQEKQDKVVAWLDKFPNDASSWSQATDELRDLARSAREHLEDLDNVKMEPLDFKKLGTPSEWNTKSKKYIVDAWGKMSDETKDIYYDRWSGWFDGEDEMAKGGKILTRRYLQSRGTNVITFGYGMSKDTVDMYGTKGGAEYFVLPNGDVYKLAEKDTFELIDKKDKYETGGYMADGGQGYDDREDERLAMEHGKIGEKDFDGSHEQKEHSRRDDARFEERKDAGGYMAEGGINKYEDREWYLRKGDGEIVEIEGIKYRLRVGPSDTKGWADPQYLFLPMYKKDVYDKGSSYYLRDYKTLTKQEKDSVLNQLSSKKYDDESSMAKGGPLEHGFRKGDCIKSIYKSYAIIENTDGYYVVNPDNGSRSSAGTDDSNIYEYIDYMSERKKMAWGGYAGGGVLKQIMPTRQNPFPQQGTSFKNIYIETTAEKLTEALGRPSIMGSSDDKVQLEWIFEVDGKIVTLYDYKEDFDITSKTGRKKKVEWHVGGNNTEAAQKAAELIKEQVGIKTEKPSYEELYEQVYGKKPDFKMEHGGETHRADQ